MPPSNARPALPPTARLGLSLDRAAAVLIVEGSREGAAAALDSSNSSSESVGSSSSASHARSQAADAAGNPSRQAPAETAAACSPGDPSRQAPGLLAAGCAEVVKSSSHAGTMHVRGRRKPSFRAGAAEAEAEGSLPRLPFLVFPFMCSRNLSIRSIITVSPQAKQRMRWFCDTAGTFIGCMGFCWLWCFCWLRCLAVTRDSWSTQHTYFPTPHRVHV